MSTATADRLDVMVIGGGLAGAAVAIELAEAGRAVTLLEKTAGPHPKVCGEFLSGEALDDLERLGMKLRSLGAVPIARVRLAGDAVLAEAKLPFQAMSLSREQLDEALLERAAAAGATVLRGLRVDSLSASTDGWSASWAGGRCAAPSVFLATGKHDLRGWPRAAGKQNDLVALKMYWRLAPDQAAALNETVELILFPGGYAGLQPIEGGLANLCLLISKAAWKRIGNSWAAMLRHMTAHAAHLARRLEGATALWGKPLALSAIPYGYLGSSDDNDGLWRLGDQAAVIPSFSGDGMSIALHSARLAAQLYLAGRGAEDYRRRLARDLKGQVGFATLLSQALVALPGAVKASAYLWPGVLTRVAAGTRIRAHAG